jgi:hypothetical protein
MQLLMRRPEIDGFIAVAPPAGNLDFSFLAPCPASGLILHGERDDVVPPEAAEKLAKKLAQQKNVTVEYRGIPGADHFFADHMPPLAKAIDDYLDKALTTAA